MQKKQLPDYPSVYWRKVAPLFVVIIALFALGWLFYFGTAAPAAKWLGVLAYIAMGVTIVYGCILSVKLMPKKRPCPTCGTMLDRADEGQHTKFHYPCADCQTDWRTGIWTGD